MVLMARWRSSGSRFFCSGVIVAAFLFHHTMNTCVFTSHVVYNVAILKIYICIYIYDVIKGLGENPVRMNG